MQFYTLLKVITESKNILRIDKRLINELRRKNAFRFWNALQKGS